jgi:hypothetical protein
MSDTLGEWLPTIIEIVIVMSVVGLIEGISSRRRK